MAHVLAGLMNWAEREEWRDRFDEVLEDHVLPACDETDLGVDDVIAILGEDFFMSTVWASAFEDLLTREFEDGVNIVDDYLKRGGSKESAAVRAYVSALRNSVTSLYEVSDIIVGQSFRARDLVRGGEPVLISERLATRSLKQWDRFAGRVVQVGKQMQISGAVLPYEYETSKELIRGLRSIGKLTKKAREGPRQGHRRGLRCCSNRAALRQRKAARDKRHLYDLLAYRRDRPHHAGHS